MLKVTLDNERPRSVMAEGSGDQVYTEACLAVGCIARMLKRSDKSGELFDMFRACITDDGFWEILSRSEEDEPDAETV